MDPPSRSQCDESLARKKDIKNGSEKLNGQFRSTRARSDVAGFEKAQSAQLFHKRNALENKRYDQGQPQIRILITRQPASLFSWEFRRVLEIQKSLMI